MALFAFSTIKPPMAQNKKTLEISGVF